MMQRPAHFSSMQSSVQFSAHFSPVTMHLGAALLIVLSFLGAFSTEALADNPVPFVNQPLVPDATAPGGPEFTLTVNGTGFVLDSVVNWNGSPLATQFVSASQLTATVPAADIATAGTASVTVVDPAPGGGASNIVFFPVTVNAGSSVEFALASPVNTGQYYPFSVAVDDFNGDGNLDLAVANNGSGFGNTLSILLGDGAGNFTLAASPTVGAGPISLAVGDFNGDGKLDFAVANSGSGFGKTLSILLGDGAGNFSLASSPATGEGPWSVAAGDFNGDGKLDLAVASITNGTVSILLGDGTGNFILASSPATGGYPDSVAVGDFNGDGKLDLAVANQCESSDCPPKPGTVSILLGNGEGNFALGSSLVVGVLPSSAAVGDFNGDGKLDVAVVNSGCPIGICSSAGSVSILLGDGTGNCTLSSSPATRGDVSSSVAVGDFNGDGKLDLAVANCGTDVEPCSTQTVSILLGDGTGNFTLAASPTVGTYLTSVAVGDFNGDGKLDLGVVSPYAGAVSILLQVLTAVTLMPPSLSFGTQLLSTASSPLTVTLANAGTASLEITDIAASGEFAQTNTCGSSVAAGASCSISVTFTPTALGTRTGTITISDNAPGSPQVVSLTGTGTGPAVSFSPAALSLGGQVVGTTSAAHTLTLTNTGTAVLSITSIAATSGFDQTNTCGASLAAGTSCTIEVTFTPSTAGEITGTLSVTDNAFGSPHRASLSSVGQDFAIGISGTETVPAGQAAYYTLQIKPLGGFNQTVALSCSGLPQFASCIFSPASIALAYGPAGVSMKVTTKAPSQTFGSAAAPWRLPPSRPPLGPTKAPWLWLGALATGLLTLAARRRRLALVSALILLSVAMWVACGGGAAPSVWTPGTPNGTFTLTVSATSGPLAHAATTTLVVSGSAGPT